MSLLFLIKKTSKLGKGAVTSVFYSPAGLFSPFTLRK